MITLNQSRPSLKHDGYGEGVTRSLICLLFFVCLTTSSEAQQPSESKRVRDLTELSLEELMNLEVTSVAKKQQRLSEAAAAIYVITQEDIHRSGAKTIAEALRMAPGLEVAQISSNTWAITSRGFNGRFANKLLVLMDGRSVYTPLFSGVFWNVQDTLLEDIDRIEVIRGPAGTLWGANAVNGVINIITKSAKETQGGLLTAGGGSEDRGFGSLRYGAQLGEGAYVRVFGKYFNRDNFTGAFGNPANDEWRMGRGGFRLDWDFAKADSLMVLGDYYKGNASDHFTVGSLAPCPPCSAIRSGSSPLSGGSLLARWQHSFSATSDMKLQMYYDRTDFESPVHNEGRNTLDLEFQHRFALTQRQDLIWGFDYRFTNDQLRNSPTLLWGPKSRRDHLFSAFIQDDVTLIEKRLRLTLGSKFEHNDYSGFEVQPNVRLLWTPQDWQTFWGAISRAVRTPSRFEHTLRANFAAAPPLSGPACPVPFPCQVALFGGRGFGSESLVAYELGYRAQVTPRLTVDIATFYHVYDNLRTFEPGAAFLETAPLPPHLVIPLRADNKMSGQAYGVELASVWSVTDRWKLGTGYTFLKMHVKRDASSADAISEGVNGESPQNQFHIRSYLDLPYDLRFDTLLYYVDHVPNQGVAGSRTIPSYVRGDLRLGWYPMKSLELSIAVQNLFTPSHPELAPGFLVTPTKIQRSVYGKVTWRF